MTSVILTWNNKDCTDVRIICDESGKPMLFENWVLAKDHAEKNFCTYEIVTLMDDKCEG